MTYEKRFTRAECEAIIDRGTLSGTPGDWRVLDVLRLTKEVIQLLDENDNLQRRIEEQRELHQAWAEQYANLQRDKDSLLHALRRLKTAAGFYNEPSSDWEPAHIEARDILEAIDAVREGK